MWCMLLKIYITKKKNNKKNRLKKHYTWCTAEESHHKFYQPRIWSFLFILNLNSFKIQSIPIIYSMNLHLKWLMHNTLL